MSAAMARQGSVNNSGRTCTAPLGTGWPDVCVERRGKPVTVALHNQKVVKLQELHEM